MSQLSTLYTSNPCNNMMHARSGMSTKHSKVDTVGTEKLYATVQGEPYYVSRAAAEHQFMALNVCSGRLSPFTR